MDLTPRGRVAVTENQRKDEKHTGTACTHIKQQQRFIWQTVLKIERRATPPHAI